MVLDLRILCYLRLRLFTISSFVVPLLLQAIVDINLIAERSRSVVACFSFFFFRHSQSTSAVLFCIEDQIDRSNLLLMMG